MKPMFCLKEQGHFWLRQNLPNGLIVLSLSFQFFLAEPKVLIQHFYRLARVALNPISPATSA
ncbi:MAG: hypothetical protein EBT64_04250 [Gammaproteobacteria bacterium]|nr:hypothetical protein [Gammaproteobacteria bacterium]